MRPSLPGLGADRGAGADLDDTVCVSPIAEGGELEDLAERGVR